MSEVENIEKQFKRSIEVKQNSSPPAARRWLREWPRRCWPRCARRGGIYLCGNGGSAADCQHIAGEFVGRFLKERAPLPCVALTTDTSVLTCLANDYSFERVFSRQVSAHVRKGDVLIGLSTSGNSQNVLLAVEAAKSSAR